MAREQASIAASPDSLMHMLASSPAAWAAGGPAHRPAPVTSTQAQYAQNPLGMAPLPSGLFSGSGFRIARQIETKSEEAVTAHGAFHGVQGLTSTHLHGAWFHKVNFRIPSRTSRVPRGRMAGASRYVRAFGRIATCHPETACPRSAASSLLQAFQYDCTCRI